MIEDNTLYRRYEDMSRLGHIEMVRQIDGDVLLRVYPDPYERRSGPGVVAEFCTHTGGGQSPKVRLALEALMEAIVQENLERPQTRITDFWASTGTPRPNVTDEAPAVDPRDADLASLRREMAAVWAYFKPNESNDMTWADEIICAHGQLMLEKEDDIQELKGAVQALQPTPRDVGPEVVDGCGVYMTVKGNCPILILHDHEVVFTTPDGLHGWTRNGKANNPETRELYGDVRCKLHSLGEVELGL